MRHSRTLAALCLAMMWSLEAMATEEPKHRVIERQGNIEVRQYEPMIVAEVVVTGDMRKAGNSGFRPLADFIFGNNKPAAKIEMTAPVTRTQSTKIEMTAPVTRVAEEDGSWTVAFVMPDQWTMETLPQPNNPDIQIREIESELIATIQFSGRASESDHEKQWLKLDLWLEQNGYEQIGLPRFAGYNAPWTPGPLRRNEVMVPVAKTS